METEEVLVVRPALEWLRWMPRYFCAQCEFRMNVSGIYRGCGNHSIEDAP